MSFADIQKDHPAALIPRTAKALLAETPAPATRIIRDAEAHAYALPAPANQTAAPDTLQGWKAWFCISLGQGRPIGIAAQPHAQGARDRLRRLEAAVTDDSQGALERQDAQGDVDIRNLTRAGMVLAAVSSMIMIWLVTR